MNPRFPLRWRIFCHIVLNAVLIFGVAFALLYFEFHAGPGSIILSATDAKLRAFTDEVAAALTEASAAERNEVLQHHGAEYGVEFGLYVDTGEYVAGNLLDLPTEVRSWFRPPRPMGEEMSDPERKAFRPHISRSPKKDGKKKGPIHEIEMFADSSGYWFLTRLPILSTDSPDMPFGALIIRTPSILFNPHLFDLRPWIFALILLGTVTFTCWAPFIRSLTRSVQEMKAGAEMISCGLFNVNLPITRSDEIGQLSEALNRMAQQLSGFVHGQKRFLGDIAHELSAPLARVQAQMGILEERVPQPLTRYVEGMGAEVTHMSTLVHDLLQFSRAGLAAEPPKLAPVSVQSLFDRVREREASTSDVRLLEGGALLVMANESGLFRALSNIVRNALRYAGQFGPILIAARQEEDSVIITVSDHGPGLPDDALDRIFAPFYRLEASRSRLTGGVGLGMAIVRSCVESSGGTVWCTNRKPKGLEVSIRLPAAIQFQTPIA